MLHPISIGFIPIFGEISLKDMEKHTERQRGGGKTGWEFNRYIILVTIQQLPKKIFNNTFLLFPTKIVINWTCLHLCGSSKSHKPEHKTWPVPQWIGSREHVPPCHYGFLSIFPNITNPPKSKIHKFHHFWYVMCIYMILYVRSSICWLKPTWNLWNPYFKPPSMESPSDHWGQRRSLEPHHLLRSHGRLTPSDWLCSGRGLHGQLGMAMACYGCNGRRG